MKIKWPISISIIVMITVIALLYTSLFPEKSFLPTFQKNNEGVVTFDIDAPIIVNVPFKMKVNMNTLGADVNAAGIYLHYDARHLQVTDIDTQSSFCQFYPEKKFDNNQGTISLACGSPHPGIKGENTLITLTFIPLSIGTTTIRLDPQSQLLASDGKGTNLLNKYPNQTINISNKL